MHYLAIFLALYGLLLVLPAQGIVDIAARGTSISSLTGNDPDASPLSKSLPSNWRIKVPLNFGAYLNDSFTSPGVLPLEFTDPKLYVDFFAYGGGPPYDYGPLNGTSTSSSPTITNVYTTPSATTSTVGETPVPSLFEGREVGSGPRNSIYGSSRWGSGLGVGMLEGSEYQWYYRPYLYNSTVSYPFGFWPIHWGSIANYYNFSLQFKSSRFRPGGAQNLILASLHEDISDSPYYYVVADAYTTKGLSTILSLPVAKGGCGMYPDNPIYTFEPEQLATNGTRTLVPADGSSRSRPNVVLGPESAMQYYRGSSVVLGTPGYTNQFSLDHNINTTYWGTTPWNLTDLFPNFFNNSGSQSTEVNMTQYQEETSFLDCLNTTIAAAIPIIDTNLTVEKPSTTTGTPRKLTRGEIIAIVICLLWFLIVFFAACSKYGRKTADWDPDTPRPVPVPLGRPWTGPQVVNALPNYSTHPQGYYYPSYPTAQHPQDQSSNIPLLLYTRNSHDATATGDDLPPPYSSASGVRR
jgi:hypothetical protein